MAAAGFRLGGRVINRFRFFSGTAVLLFPLKNRWFGVISALASDVEVIVDRILGLMLLYIRILPLLGLAPIALWTLQNPRRKWTMKGGDTTGDDDLQTRYQEHKLHALWFSRPCPLRHCSRPSPASPPALCPPRGPRKGGGFIFEGGAFVRRSKGQNITKPSDHIETALGGSLLGPLFRAIRIPLHREFRRWHERSHRSRETKFASFEPGQRNLLAFMTKEATPIVVPEAGTFWIFGQVFPPPLSLWPMLWKRHHDAKANQQAAQRRGCHRALC